MSIDEGVLMVIQSLYDAAMDESLWPAALQTLTDFTGSQAATFWVLDGSEKPRLPILTILNFDPRFMEAYQNGMVPLDPTVQYLVRHPDQPIVHDGLVITEREKDRHPYYDWHGAWSDTRFRLVGQTRPAPGMQAGVALHRTGKAGRFETHDIQRFEILHRHLERAVAIGVRLGSVGAMRQWTTEILDRNPAAVLLLDERKRIIYANRRAEDLLVEGDGLTSFAGALGVPGKADNDKLQNFISQAVSGIAAPGFALGGAMRLPRRSGKRSYGIFLAPLSRHYPVLSALRPAACVMITDPADESPLPVGRLQAVFGLTDAEARLASLLAAGHDLRAAASELKVTYGTARVRLAGIFQKTETRRQGELIKVLFTTLSV